MDLTFVHTILHNLLEVWYSSMNIYAYETFLVPDIIGPDTSFNSEFNNAKSLILRSRKHVAL